jgi:hypothetical protein
MSFRDGEHVASDKGCIDVRTNVLESLLGDLPEGSEAGVGTSQGVRSAPDKRVLLNFDRKCR